MNNRTKNVGRFGAIAGLAVGLAIAFQPMAGASVAAPGISVSPSTGLADGDSVSVSVTGFAPNATVFVGECATISGEAACPAGDPLQVTTDASGAATAPLTVARSFEGFRLDGTSVGTVDCTSVQCFVGAGDSSGAEASAPIWFG